MPIIASLINNNLVFQILPAAPPPLLTVATPTHNHRPLGSAATPLVTPRLQSKMNGSHSTFATKMSLVSESVNGHLTVRAVGDGEEMDSNVEMDRLVQDNNQDNVHPDTIETSPVYEISSV